MKKLLSIILSLVLVITTIMAIPFSSALAAVVSGDLNDAASWTKMGGGNRNDIATTNIFYGTSSTYKEFTPAQLDVSDATEVSENDTDGKSIKVYGALRRYIVTDLTVKANTNYTLHFWYMRPPVTLITIPRLHLNEG